MRPRWLAPAALLLVLAAPPAARAQWGYPGGYGGFGFGGWTVYDGKGNLARGLGWLAAGQGAFNLQTAEANQINAHTNMMLNEYMFEGLMLRNQRAAEARANRSANRRAAQAEAYDRIRNNPGPREIQNGTALNALLDELSDPGTFYAVNGPANVQIPGTLVEAIAFRCDNEMIAMNLNDLTDAEPAPGSLLGSPAFADLVTAYRAAADAVVAEAEANNVVGRATVRALRAPLFEAYDRLRADRTVPAADRLDAIRHVKAMIGLSYMFGDPQALSVYLAGVGQRDDITLGKLIGFMQAFNLHFGPATTPTQREAYTRLFGILRDTARAVFLDGTGSTPANVVINPDRTERPAQFFEHMDVDELRKVLDREAPPAPAPAPAP